MRYLYHGRTYIDDMHTICILSLMLQAIYPESPVVGFLLVGLYFFRSLGLYTHSGVVLHVHRKDAWESILPLLIVQYRSLKKDNWYCQ